jgi:hypothetical protein
MSMAKGQVVAGGTMTGSVLGTLDEMEPDLRHLAGLITAFRILGEADDSIEPVAVSSLARCARDAGRTRAKLADGDRRPATALIMATWRDFRLDFADEPSVAVPQKIARE